VTRLPLDDGFLAVSNMLNDTSSNNMERIVNPNYGGTYEFGYYSVSVVDGIFYFSQEEETIIKWVVANLTCQDAQSNAKYACVSHNSNCQNVTRGKTHYGYRCKCNDGFHGNPYLQNENTCTGYISLLNHICTASHFSNTTFIKKATIHTCYIFRVFRILMHLLPPPAPPRSHIALPFEIVKINACFYLHR
jgi:hypothetical protein